MTSFAAGVKDTLTPRRDSKDSLLPPVLVALTAVTGLVDAFSYLMLGHVFVANMTGNVVFLAFALAGASGFAAPDSLIAIAAFGLGAIIAGRLTSRAEANRRGRLLALAAAGQAALLAASAILAAVTSTPIPAGVRYPLIVLLATTMGIQNAIARKLAVPDMTTTVLTLTITGLAADRDAAKAARRLISVAAMLAGACVGAVLVLHVQIVYPLVVALLILVAVAVMASRMPVLPAGTPISSTRAFSENLKTMRKNEQHCVSRLTSSATRAATCGAGRSRNLSSSGEGRSTPCTASLKSWLNSAARNGCSAVGSVHVSGTQRGSE
jgi:uncharacterized membrane protein YoaK (UPF0700 family)